MARGLKRGCSRRNGGGGGRKRTGRNPSGLRTRSAVFACALLTAVMMGIGCTKGTAEQPPESPKPQEKKPAVAADLFKPRGVAVGPDGRVLGVDMAGYVSRFSPDGVFELRWKLPEQDTGTPSGLYVDAHGRVWVPDTHNSRVLIYDADGNESARFGKRGTGDGEFLLPTSVVVDSEGYVYVCEYGGNDRVSKFTAQLEYVSSFGGPGDGLAALAAPYGLCLDDAGTIWVADSGNHRACRFSRSGKLLTTIGGLGKKPGELRYPVAVAWSADPSGRHRASAGCLLVCEKSNHRLQAFDVSGRSCGVWGQPGRGRDQFDQPTGIAIDRANRVLVADSKNNRICVVSGTWYSCPTPPPDKGTENP